MAKALVTGSFDNPQSRDLRFLQEAATSGKVHLLIWPDEFIRKQSGKDPKYPLAERQYFFGAMRYVDKILAPEGPIDPDTIPEGCGFEPDIWIVDEPNDTAEKRAYCKTRGLRYRVVKEEELEGFPAREADPRDPARKKVIVTGCYDWFHSGHVRFFEETSELGNLYVVVGHDANIELLKGKGHPMYKENERRYMAQSVRFVTQAYVSSGQGWMDARPEIEVIQPDIYAVNEDGDVPEKQTFCEANGLEYVVLKRLPKEGLTRRTSTDLRGF